MIDTDKICEFGCECTIEHAPGRFGSILDTKDFQRLIEEKTARAKRYIELQEKAGRVEMAD